MNLENLEVKHKSFGLGVIVNVQGKYITVRFDTQDKVFVYPDIFEKFLTLADGSVSEEILSDLSATNMRKQQIRDQKAEENIRSMIKGIVIPGKEILPTDVEDEDERNKNKGEEI